MKSTKKKLWEKGGLGWRKRNDPVRSLGARQCGVKTRLAVPKPNGGGTAALHLGEIPRQARTFHLAVKNRPPKNPDGGSPVFGRHRHAQH